MASQHSVNKTKKNNENKIHCHKYLNFAKNTTKITFNLRITKNYIYAF